LLDSTVYKTLIKLNAVQYCLIWSLQRSICQSQLCMWWIRNTPFDYVNWMFQNNHQSVVRLKCCCDMWTYRFLYLSYRGCRKPNRQKFDIHSDGAVCSSN